ncbi:hypothetical protein B0H12DRAFT_1142734 [Mycena haematopus]|nr:hypothetical protein B0H12DRAFT_1142734 [Mycena haematopus]
MDCQFSFGPNRSYFCRAGTVYAWSERSLPSGLARLLEDSAHPQSLDLPYDVAFPMDPGTYAACWRTKSGQDWYEDGRLGPSYARLGRFIKNVATKGGYTTRTVFGPNGSFFSMSPSGFCWQNLPADLEDDMHSCMKLRRPTSVALGVQGSYIVLYNDGTIVFDLRGQYPLVESMIRNTQEAARRRGVMYVALNPFVPNEYYAVYGDGSASWNFPTAWSTDVTAISRQIKAMPIPAPTLAPALPARQQQVRAASIPPPAPVAVSSGGTGAPSVQTPVPAPSPAPSMGGTITGIASAVGNGFEGLPQGAASPTPPGYVPAPSGNLASGTPAPVPVVHSTPPPGYVPAPSGNLASGTPAPPPVPVVQQAPAQTPPQSPHAHHKVNWKQGLSMGLKAAEGINKIVHVFQDPSQASQQQQGTGQNGFDITDIGADLAAVSKIVNALQEPAPAAPQPQQQQQGTPQNGFDFTNIQADVQAITKLVNAFQDPAAAAQAQQQQQQQGTPQNSFNFTNLQADLSNLTNNFQQQQGIPQNGFDYANLQANQVVVQETFFDNGNTTTTWQTTY